MNFDVIFKLNEVSLLLCPLNLVNCLFLVVCILIAEVICLFLVIVEAEKILHLDDNNCHKCLHCSM